MNDIKRIMYLGIISVVAFFSAGCYTSFSQLSPVADGNYLSTGDGYEVTTADQDYMPIVSDRYIGDGQADISLNLTIGSGYGSWYYPDQLVLFYNPDPWSSISIIYMDPFPSYRYVYPYYSPHHLAVLDPWWWDWNYCSFYGMVYYPVPHPIYYWDDWYRYDNRYPQKKRDWAKRDSRRTIHRESGSRELAPSRISRNNTNDRITPDRTVKRISEKKRIIKERIIKNTRNEPLKERIIREHSNRVTNTRTILHKSPSKKISRERSSGTASYKPKNKKRVSEKTVTKPRVYPRNDTKINRTKSYRIVTYPPKKKTPGTRTSAYTNPKQSKKTPSTGWTTRKTTTKSTSYRAAPSGKSGSYSAPESRNSSSSKSRRRSR